MPKRDAAPLDPPADDADQVGVQVAPPPGEPVAAGSTVRPVAEGDPATVPPTPVQEAPLETSADWAGPDRPYSQTAPEEVVQLQRALEAANARLDAQDAELVQLRSMIAAYTRDAAPDPEPEPRYVTPTMPGAPSSVQDEPVSTLGGVRPPGVPDDGDWS